MRNYQPFFLKKIVNEQATNVISEIARIARIVPIWVPFLVSKPEIEKTKTNSGSRLEARNCVRKILVLVSNNRLKERNSRSCARFEMGSPSHPASLPRQGCL